jgi:hypothetical protein
MSLESLTGASVFINALVNTNPVGATDPKSQGDDHIRGIKNVILNTFPAITGAVTATHTEMNLLHGLTTLPFPTGTKMVFFQAAAPTGWTQDVTNTDAALRVVSTAGGGTGGTHGVSSPPSTEHTHTGPSHTHTTASVGLSIAQMPIHTHSMGRVCGGYGGLQFSGGSGMTDTSPNTGPSGSGAGHDHGDTGAQGTGITSSTTPTAFAPKYINVIVCSKN